MAATEEEARRGAAFRWQPARHPSSAAEGRNAYAVIIALSGITALGFALRLAGIDQTLFGDERYTYSIVTQNGLGGVWHQVYDTSITPPLHYYLAWLFVQLGGDQTVLIRLPSLILGTATIPLLFVLGRRVGGTKVGLLAAALLVLSPFAIFYSTEARAYETVVFLVTLSVLALLKARDGERRVWWVVYVVASCAAIWAHYTAVFVLIAEAGWALWTRPAQWRRLLLAQAAIVVGYLAWVPGYLHQRHNPGVTIFGQFSSVTLSSVFDLPLRMLIGHPFVQLSGVPGNLGWLLLLGLLILLVAAAARRVTSVGALVPRPTVEAVERFGRSETGLMLLLALATPVGLLIYALFGSTLWSSERELSASEPALMVIIALALVTLARTAPVRVGAAVLAGIGAVLVVIGVRSVGADFQRPPYRQAAQYLDSVAGGSPVVELPLAVSADQRLGQSTLSLYFRRSHPLYTSGSNDAAAWRAEAAGRTVYYVAPLQQPVLAVIGTTVAAAERQARTARTGGPDGLAVVRGTRVFPGFYPLVVQRDQGSVSGHIERRGGQEIISWSFGRRVFVSPSAEAGRVTGIKPSGRALLISGWGADSRDRRPAEWFLLFSRGSLIAVTQPDFAAAKNGAPADSGFELAVQDAPRDHSAIQVFAVRGNHASELPFTPAASAEAR